MVVHGGPAFGYSYHSNTLLQLGAAELQSGWINASCEVTAAYANCSGVSGASSSDYLRSDYGSYTQATEQLEGERVQSVGAFNCCPPKPKVAMR